MRIRIFLLALILGNSALAADKTADAPAPQANSFRFGPRFGRPGFADIESFVEAVEVHEEPWRELLEPDQSPETEHDASTEIVWSDAWNIKVIHHSRKRAIVFARYKANRTAPFSAVVFLLSRKGERWHVSDFIRRSVGYESYSDMSAPKKLKLRPPEHLHFYLTSFIGGRKFAVQTDEFYMVEGNRLRRTLLLKNDGAYMSPADPWREFDQSSRASAVSGRLHILMQRTWGLENGEERKQSFAVVFRWDPRRKEFTSANASRLFVNEPSPWISKGLPTPPGRE